MKRKTIIYWIITSLFAAFMLFSAIPDALLVPDAVTFMNHLGYPDYFTRFIGIAKILGCIALFIPVYPAIKEWAYAGLAFDLIGATYSLICVEGLQLPVSFMILPLSFCFLSYYLYHQLEKPADEFAV